jgi:hypothetical protein
VTSNKSANATFRDAVIAELHRAGLVAARRPPEPKGLTVSERITRDHGDVVGLPWAIGVRAEQAIRLSEAQSEIEGEAEQGGHELRAVIHRRKGHDVSDAYVVMPLSVYVEVLRRMHPGELLSAKVRSGEV